MTDTRLSKANLKREIQSILKNADLNTTTARKVRLDLQEKLGCDFTERKKEFDQLVMEVINDSDDDEPGGVILNDETINISSDDSDIFFPPENDYRISDSESDSLQNLPEARKIKIRAEASSSDDDDLIVVKADYTTIDPITRKEIVDPVRNKKCNHIYERETILQTIVISKRNGKSVKCPYIGCICRDFRKSDLIKDKEVLNYIVKVKQEREKEAAKKMDEKKKNRVKRKEGRDKRKAERKKIRKDGGVEFLEESDGSVSSSDSIICV